MARTSYLLPSEFVVSWTPTITWMADANMKLAVWRSYVQCAAVSTCRGEMIDPPHQGVLSPGDTRPTFLYVKECIESFLPILFFDTHLPGILMYFCLNSPHNSRLSSGHSTNTCRICIHSRRSCSCGFNRCSWCSLGCGGRCWIQKSLQLKKVVTNAINPLTPLPPFVTNNNLPDDLMTTSLKRHWQTCYFIPRSKKYIS